MVYRSPGWGLQTEHGHIVLPVWAWGVCPYFLPAWPLQGLNTPGPALAAIRA